jgi:flagellar protein FlaG
MSGIESVGASSTDAALRLSVRHGPVSAPHSSRPLAASVEPARLQGVSAGVSLDDQVARVSRELDDLSPHVTFVVDHEDGEVVVRILDPQTNEVVRQIPPDQLLAMRQSMDEYLGMLADEAA